ncbi:expressed unknown protein [Seminavis robusta]|uniref:Uncharacterized protein n=1 Tax=Seminavis robusta TaxID=568900 RepID=A0A9N8EJB0_9STRA|nr:expressed unknown protein [Seminavis robusta]|eukprot:Sro1191_g250940.1 n/a (177) ;mRNA; r:20427-20957
MRLLCSVLLLCAVGAVSGQGQPVEAIYRPADGFYICPQPGNVCNVVGCDKGICSIINNGFDESTVDGRVVYTSRSPNADLSIAGGDDTTAIRCESSCTCQEIFRGVGCNVPGSEKLSEGILDGHGSNVMEYPKETPKEEPTKDSTLSVLNAESSAMNSLVLGGSAIFSVVAFLWQI